MLIEIKKYPRQCDKCGKGMFEGYIYDGGCFDTLECAGLTRLEWEKIYDDEGDNYWTEWTLEDCDDLEDLQFQAVLAKNNIAREIRNAQIFKREPSYSSIVAQLGFIEEFITEMNQPSVKDLIEDTKGVI
jgi:hypothetical protein